MKKYSYSEAITVFKANIASRITRIKPGSEPFIMIQPHGKPGKAVLIMHGFSDSPGTIRAIAEMYYKKGFHVVAPLYNDHGLLPELQKEALLKGTLKDWRDDVDFAAAITKALSSDEKIHVAGYSMGGTFTVDLSWRFPNLVASRALFAPLFKENGPVYTMGIILAKWFKYGWHKTVDEADIFYKSMSYRMTQEMHRITRQVRPRILRRFDEIPTSVFRVDRINETTVDDDYIDRFVEVYKIPENRHTTYQNGDVKFPVLHRDATSIKVHLSGEANPALHLFQRRLNSFIDEIE